MHVDALLDRLEGVKRSGQHHTARCPGHEDKKNSLSVAAGDNGGVVIKCFAGCDSETIMGALGLKLSDLMPPKRDDWAPANNETSYRINLPGGGVVEHVRIDAQDGKRFIWRRDGKSGLGGMKVCDVPLYQPAKQGKSRQLFLCEGEKSAIAAAALGLESYGTVTGASSCPSGEALAVCKGRDVVLWADNDDPGRTHMRKVAAALQGLASSVVTISTGKEKDDAADYTDSMADLRDTIEIARGRRVIKTTTVAQYAKGAMDQLARFSMGDFSGRVPTGIKKVDRFLRGGMMPGALYLLGAPSGHGKTSLLQCVSFHCARERGAVLFASPEMSGMELAEREIIKISGKDVYSIESDQEPNARVMALHEMEKASEQLRKENLEVRVIEDPEIDMRAIADAANGVRNLKLVVIDYAQEVADRNEKARHLSVGEVGKASIILGKELNVPVIVASQVNVGKDSDGLSYSFRETKDLEHRAHASIIMEVTRAKTPNSNGFYPVESTRVFARKNRSGAVFSADVEYKPELFQISDIGQWVPKKITQERRRY